jgi:hypothetical protein
MVYDAKERPPLSHNGHRSAAIGANTFMAIFDCTPQQHNVARRANFFALARFMIRSWEIYGCCCCCLMLLLGIKKLFGESLGESTRAITVITKIKINGHYFARDWIGSCESTKTFPPCRMRECSTCICFRMVGVCTPHTLANSHDSSRERDN